MQVRIVLVSSNKNNNNEDLLKLYFFRCTNILKQNFHTFYNIFAKQYSIPLWFPYRKLSIIHKFP